MIKTFSQRLITSIMVTSKDVNMPHYPAVDRGNVLLPWTKTEGGEGEGSPHRALYIPSLWLRQIF